MMRVELLPARFGDCILVGWGHRAIDHRMVIDAGLKATYEESLLPRLRDLGLPLPLELLVVTHIDRDHIRGVLPLLDADPRVVTAKDVWFNGRKHLPSDEQGAADGEEVGRLLQKGKWRWNAAFEMPGGKNAVVVPPDGPLPSVTLADEARITLLSPYRDNLVALADAWDDALGSWHVDAVDDIDHAPGAPAAGDDTMGRKPLASISPRKIRELHAQAFREDRTKPNGSSIAFVFEHRGHRVLFAADAHPSVLARSLERLSPRQPYELSALKLSHHGSQANLSNALLDKVRTKRFLFSSDGSAYGHPDPETIARVVATKNRTLCFNHRSGYTTVWDDEECMEVFDYTVEYPPPGSAGFVLELP